MKSPTKTLKIVIGSLLLLVVMFSLYFGHVYYEKKTYDDYELTFMDSNGWKWHDKSKRIQIKHSDWTEKLTLRKVNRNDNYVIYAFKEDNYTLTALVLFPTKCEPSTEIEIAQTYSGGSQKKLYCMKGGDALLFGKKNIHPYNIWAENLGGFKIREDFSFWDFTILDQNITLSKSKKTED